MASLRNAAVSAANSKRACSVELRHVDGMVLLAFFAFTYAYAEIRRIRRPLCATPRGEHTALRVRMAAARLFCGTPTTSGHQYFLVRQARGLRIPTRGIVRCAAYLRSLSLPHRIFAFTLFTAYASCVPVNSGGCTLPSYHGVCVTRVVTSRMGCGRQRTVRLCLLRRERQRTVMPSSPRGGKRCFSTSSVKRRRAYHGDWRRASAASRCCARLRWRLRKRLAGQRRWLRARAVFRRQTSSRRAQARIKPPGRGAARRRTDNAARNIAA